MNLYFLSESGAGSLPETGIFLQLPRPDWKKFAEMSLVILRH
jgi:hypothetical protein